MQFWKGQRIVFSGLLGTVYQDQGLDQTVKITLDRTKSVVRSVWPRELYLVSSQEEEDRIDLFLTRQWLP